MAILSPLFIILPYCTNMYAIKLYDNVAINISIIAHLYFEEKLVLFCFLVLISDVCHTSLQLACGRMFGMHIFDCRLSKRELLQSSFTLQFNYSVFLENTPQLVIQTIYIGILCMQASPAAILATTASLPENLLKYLSAPIPYIIGIPNYWLTKLPDISALAEVIASNLDEDKTTSSFIKEALRPLHAPCWKLEGELKRLLKQYQIFLQTPAD